MMDTHAGSSGNRMVVWIALVLVLLGGAGLIWLLFFNQAEPTAPIVATRTPLPTFTAVGPANQPSATPLAVTSTPVAPTQAPTASPVPLTVTPVLPTATPVPPTATPVPTLVPTMPPPKSLHMNSPEYGMQAFLWWRPEVASRDMGMVKEAGFGWIKQNIGWRDVEGAGKGQFDWSKVDWIVSECNKLGLDLLVRVDHQPEWSGGGYPTNGPPNNYADYGDFLFAMASRYKGRVRAYEVWNEPNLAREWGNRPPDAGQYVALLRVAYQRIKQADANAMVVSAGLSPTTASGAIASPDMTFLRQMYALGGKRYFDALGAHGAGFKAPPEMSPDDVANNAAYNHGEPVAGRVYCFRHVEDLRRIMVENGDSEKQVMVLEFGWTIDPRQDSPYYWHSVLDEQVQADYFVRAYQWARANWSPWIGLMSLIYIADPDWKETDEQYWWAISVPGYPDFRPRAAYTQLKAMQK